MQCEYYDFIIPPFFINKILHFKIASIPDRQLPDGDCSLIVEFSIVMCYQMLVVYTGANAQPCGAWRRADVFKINDEDEDACAYLVPPMLFYSAVSRNILCYYVL